MTDLHTSAHRAWLQALGRPARGLCPFEYGGRIRDALLDEGHDAYSLDLLDTDVVGPHIVGDAREFLQQTHWDMIIAVGPPCTYLASSQAWRCLPKHDPDGIRAGNRERGLDMVAAVLNTPCERLIMENPKGVIPNRLELSTKTGLWEVVDYYDARQRAQSKGYKPSCPASQMINPFQHGHAESKETLLWTRNMPLITPTNTLDIETSGWWYDGCNGGTPRWRWPNQTGRTGAPKMVPSAARGHTKSLTFAGVARAMGAAYGAGETTTNPLYQSK